jgi:hypothetical protein
MHYGSKLRHAAANQGHDLMKRIFAVALAVSLLAGAASAAPYHHHWRHHHHHWHH